MPAHQSTRNPRCLSRNGLPQEYVFVIRRVGIRQFNDVDLQCRRQSTAPVRGSSDDIRKRMDDIYAEIQHSWRNGQFHLPLKFMEFYKADVMFLFVRAAIGYSLAFVKVKTLEKELRQMLQDRKRCNDSEMKERDEDDQQQALAELKERLERAVETHKSCTTSMSTTYARLVLHCSNYENHKEDERFFECVYFFVCSVVKLGITAEYWRPIEEELGFLFRGAQFSANIKLHATTAYQASSSSTDPQDTSTSSHSGTRSLLGTASGGSNNSSSPTTSNANCKKIQSLPAGAMKDTIERERIAAEISVFEVPKSRISHFAPSVPVRRIVAELQATKNRAARNMELSQALRDRIRTQRSEDRRRLLEAAISPRQSIVVDTLDAAATDPVCTRPNTTVSPRISRKITYTTRSPALNHLLPTTEERVKLTLKGYEQELQEHRQSLRTSSSISSREFWRK